MNIATMIVVAGLVISGVLYRSWGQAVAIAAIASILGVNLARRGRERRLHDRLTEYASEVLTIVEASGATNPRLLRSLNRPSGLLVDADPPLSEAKQVELVSELTHLLGQRVDVFMADQLAARARRHAEKTARPIATRRSTPRRP